MKLNEAKNILNTNGYRVIKESLSQEDIAELAEVLLAVYNVEDQDTYESFCKNYDKELADELINMGLVEITDEDAVAGSYITVTKEGLDLVRSITSLFPQM